MAEPGIESGDFWLIVNEVFPETSDKRERMDSKVWNETFLISDCCSI